MTLKTLSVHIHMILNMPINQVSILHDCNCLLALYFFFFLNDTAPTDFSPLPHPAALRFSSPDPPPQRSRPRR